MSRVGQRFGSELACALGVALLVAQLAGCEGAKPLTLNGGSGSGGTKSGAAGTAGAATEGSSAGRSNGGEGGTAGTGTAGGGPAGTGGAPTTDPCASPSMPSGGAPEIVAGAGGEAAGLDPERSMTEACLTYELARLARQRECAGEPPQELLEAAFVLDSCPDLYFAAGSTATVEGLAGCAETWGSFPCENVVRGLEPACAVRGTRQEAEACAFGSQCESGACPHAHRQCGTCIARARPGEACDGAHVCDVGYVCDDTCVTPEADYVPDSVATGDACIQHVDCAGSDMCHPGPDGGSLCVARIPLGGSCAGAAGFCEDDAFCHEGECRAYPQMGEACGLMPSSVVYIPCAPGLACVLVDAPFSGTCRPLPATTEPCAGGGLACPHGTLCLTRSPCSARCIEVALPGQPCNESILCHPGSECRSGVCEPVASQGLFEQWCSGA
jgi:hypothetical protein